MARDVEVDLVFSHMTPRYLATGVDPNDLQRLVMRIERWDDWCRIWCEEGGRHEALAADATGRQRRVTASEANLRASIYFHYAKHLFAHDPSQYLAAHQRMLACYQAGAADADPPIERVAIPFDGTTMVGNLRRPPGVARPPVAIVLPGLDACKEELHAWCEAFVRRRMATLAIDGPGQGETAFRLPITSQWGKVIGAAIDMLERRGDVDAYRVAVVGQSLGALYAPLAAAFEPRIKACVANCGPFDFAAVLPTMPAASQETFRVRSHAKSHAQAREIARGLTLEGMAQRITCPLLVVYGAGDKLIPVSEGERLARAASGSTELVVFEEGNHVCFNISYKFRPLTADWTAERLTAIA
ncbi:MAG TPA: alpha/beta fold hydrolase [Xanthobacteraceae bacterium]|jgi:2,6-dihydroxypseudooxynicotine hydrolase